MKRILNPKLSRSRKYTEEEMARGFMLKAMSNQVTFNKTRIKLVHKNLSQGFKILSFLEIFNKFDSEKKEIFKHNSDLQ